MQVKMTKITKRPRNKHEKKRKQVQHKFKLSMSRVHCKEESKTPGLSALIAVRLNTRYNAQMYLNAGLLSLSFTSI